jgi:hypothetical protein
MHRIEYQMRLDPQGLNKIKDSLLNWFTGESDTYSVFLQRVASSNLSAKVLSYNIFGIIVASSANFSMGMHTFKSLLQFIDSSPNRSRGLDRKLLSRGRSREGTRGYH